jgi:Mn2+/Fe2+ NRAMP family transporter
VQVRARGEIVGDVEKNFCQRWNESSADHLEPLAVPAPDPRWNTPAQAVRTIPQGVYAFAAKGHFGIQHALITAIQEAEHWKMGLGPQAYTAPGFYTVITLSLLAGVELAISGFSPIKALFYSQILNGLIAPVLLVLMVVLVSRRSLMGAYVAGRVEKIGGWAAVVVMTAADLALAYSLTGGH